jgi:maltose alpha-D-glucosyltransferase/alpha-amylase
MHLALVKDATDDAFRPEPFDAGTQLSFATKLQKDIEATFAQLAARIDSLPADVRGPADRLCGQRGKLAAVAAAFGAAEPSGARIRVHGDLHLGQVLFTGDDFMLIDFEGEPARPLVERRAKRSPLADVAGMLRSFHYAAVAAARTLRVAPEADVDVIDARALAWHRWVTAAYLEGYLSVAAEATFLPSPPALSIALDAHLLEKALYELRYELDNRPDWALLPIAGLLDVAAE